MMVSNMTDRKDNLTGTATAVRAILATMAATFFAGLTAALVPKVLRMDATLAAPHPKHYGLLLLAITLLAASLWYTVRSARRFFRDTKMTPRSRRLAMAMGVAIVVSPILGVALASVEHSTGASIGSNAPIPAGIAIALIVGSLLILVPTTWIWHRNIDEHESEAYRTGALIALYFFTAAAPIWWLAHRGGLVPPVNGVVLYMATVVVWTLVWLRERYF
jgi:hypothetical protein